MENAQQLVGTFLHLAASQVATRIISFVFNVLVTRRLSPDDYGYSIQFYLLISTILFLSREGFRRGCLRNSENNLRKVVSVAWLTVPAGICTSVLACAAVLFWTHENDYRRAVVLYGCASIIEILSEPCYIIAQSLGLVKQRVVIETTAALSRCLVSYILVLGGIGMHGGLIFAYGQVAYGVCLLIGYWSWYLLFHRESKSFTRESLGHPDWALLQLCGLFTVQSVQKFVLQEAEKFILVFSQTTYNQGVFGLVENLGSLVVRTVLQTFEESVFTIFSKSYSEKRDWKSVENIFLLSMKLVSILGLTFAAFGPSYSYVLLRLLYGTKWSDGEAPSALGVYCFYVMFLALNGVTEAFLHAVITKDQLRSSNKWLFVFSVGHICSSLAFIRMWGCIGLILANCFNMSMRIVYSTVSIGHIFRDSNSFSIRRALPAVEVMLAFIGAATATKLSERQLLVKSEFYSTAPIHVGTGIACLLLLATCIHHFEKSTIQELKNLLKRRD